MHATTLRLRVGRRDAAAAGQHIIAQPYIWRGLLLEDLRGMVAIPDRDDAEICLLMQLTKSSGRKSFYTLQ